MAPDRDRDAVDRWLDRRRQVKPIPGQMDVDECIEIAETGADGVPAAGPAGPPLASEARVSDDKPNAPGGPAAGHDNGTAARDGVGGAARRDWSGELNPGNDDPEPKPKLTPAEVVARRLRGAVPE